MFLTVNQLEEAAPYIGYKRIELILPNFNATCAKYKIDNYYRIAHFLTQLIVESNYLRLIQEPGNGHEYESIEELGNTQKGDGRKYISRGYIKLLGRKAYEEYSKFSSVDVLNYPHFATTPKVAMDISGWLWDSNKLNEAADRDDIFEVTRLLTGGEFIMRERMDVLAKVKKVLGIK